MQHIMALYVVTGGSQLVVQVAATITSYLDEYHFYSPSSNSSHNCIHLQEHRHASDLRCLWEATISAEYRV